MLDVYLQDAVLVGRPPAVGPEEVLHGVEVHTLGPMTRAPSVSRTAVPSTLSVWDRRASACQAAAVPPGRRSCAPYPTCLGARPVRPPTRGLGAVVVKQTDDAIATKVAARHRRTQLLSLRIEVLANQCRSA